MRSADPDRERAAHLEAGLCAQLATADAVDGVVLNAMIAAALTFGLAEAILAPGQAAQMLRAMAARIEQQAAQHAPGHA